MTSDRSQRLLDSLRGVDCPGLEKFSGSDLDWMFEDPDSAQFLDFLTDFLESMDCSKTLTVEELAQFEELKANDPDSILEGKALDEALEALEFINNTNNDEDFEDLNDSDLRSNLSNVSELLDLQSVALDQTSKVASGLSKHLSMEAENLKLLQGSVMKKAEADFRQQQESVMSINERFNEALDNVKAKTNLLSEVLAQFGTSQSPIMVSEANFEEFERENLIFLDLFKQSFKNHFHKKSDELSTYYNGNREALEMELSRLRKSYEDSERNRILSKAKCAGLQKENDYLTNVYEDIKGKDILEPFDVNSLLLTSDEIERKINSLQNDIFTSGQEKLNKLVERCSAFECDKISALTRMAQTVEQTDTIKRLKSLEDLALTQRCRQAVIWILCQKECNDINDLFLKLTHFNDQFMSSLCKQVESESQCCANIKSFEQEKSLGVLHEADRVMTLLLVILTGKDISSITIVDAINSVKGFREEIKQLELDYMAKRKGVEDAQKELEKISNELHKILNLDSGSHFALSCEEIVTNIDHLQSELRMFEMAVKKGRDQWNENVKLFSDPHFKTQKKLWIDYLVNPKIAVANADVMKKKST